MLTVESVDLMVACDDFPSQWKSVHIFNSGYFDKGLFKQLLIHTAV